MSAHLRFAEASAWAVDHTATPPSTTTTRAKRYPRFERRRFPPETEITTDAVRRVSTRRFHRGRELSTGDLCALMTGILPSADAYPHGSAGGLYAVETFLLPRRVAECDADVLLHVLRDERALETLWAAPTLVHDAFPSQTWAHDAALLIVLAPIVAPYVARYGERGYRFALLEAGAMTHELEIRASRQGLACCVLGGFVDAAISSALDLELGEQPVVCLAIGWA